MPSPIIRSQLNSITGLFVWFAFAKVPSEAPTLFLSVNRNILLIPITYFSPLAVQKFVMPSVADKSYEIPFLSYIFPSLQKARSSPSVFVPQFPSKDNATIGELPVKFCNSLTPRFKVIYELFFLYSILSDFQKAPFCHWFLSLESHHWNESIWIFIIQESYLEMVM